MIWPEPFGGIMFLSLATVTLFTGLVIAIRGRESKSEFRKGITIIAAPWMVIVLISLIFPSIDEWNPILQSDEAAFGFWEGSGYKIQLNSDSTFTLNYKDQSLEGTWRRMDFNVYMRADTGKEHYMRFVEDSGKLILLPKPPIDESPRPGPITKKR
jgi:hypothetical protein